MKKHLCVWGIIVLCLITSCSSEISLDKDAAWLCGKEWSGKVTTKVMNVSVPSDFMISFDGAGKVVGGSIPPDMKASFKSRGNTVIMILRGEQIIDGVTWDYTGSYEFTPISDDSCSLYAKAEQTEASGVSMTAVMTGTLTAVKK